MKRPRGPGNRLKAWRKRQGMSQVVLAQLLGCRQQQLSRYERQIGVDGFKVPPSDVMKKIVRLTGGELDANYFNGLSAQPVAAPVGAAA